MVEKGQDVVILEAMKMENSISSDVLEAMKMENSISSDVAGRVTRIFVAEGDTVTENAALIEIGSADAKVETSAPVHHSANANKVLAPLPGRVISVLVNNGDKVKKGQDVVVLEAMKMENSISSDYEGTVVNINVTEGDTVSENAVLIEIE